MIKTRTAALSEIGRVRRRNEDCAILDEAHGLFGVADGVGGVPGGAEAAQAARDCVLSIIRAWPGGQEPDLRAMVREASNAVAERARIVSPLTGIASTLTLGCSFGGRLIVAHVGDSRCYALQRGRLVRLTEDHWVENEASRKRKRGEAVLEYAAKDARALTRWLGSPGQAEPDLVTTPLLAGDRYLFCTDGVSGALSDAEIASILARPAEPAAILGELIALALNRGGLDNATGVLVHVDEA